METAEEKGRLVRYLAGLIGRNESIKGVPMTKGIDALRAKKDMMKHFLGFISENNIGL